MKTTRKAFTIVELAIVLVVIGIILGMVVKGKALVRTARLKAEVAKINKFEAAIATYYAKTGEVPPYYKINDGNLSEIVVDHRPMMELGMFSEAERKNYFVPDYNDGSTNTYKWSFFRCSALRGSTFVGPTGICVGVASTTGRAGAPNWGLAYSDVTRMPNELVCEIEMIKDDENVTAGLARMPLAQPDVAYFEDSNVFSDCASIPWNDRDSGGRYQYNTYAIRVF